MRWSSGRLQRSTKHLTAIAATLVLLLASGGAAHATANPDSVSFTLEGCRNDGTITLPNGSVCADGNSGNPGYDVISAPVLNTALSSASCAALSTTGQLTAAPGVGGTDVSIYRTLTITQARNTTCVYDYFERLALGSHLFPGSSLHSDLLNQDLGTAGIGAKDVSIPVKQISPQQLAKDMAASQGADNQWSVTKEGTPASVSFGDVCKAGAPDPQAVSIKVTWTLTRTAGGINRRHACLCDEPRVAHDHGQRDGQHLRQHRSNDAVEHDRTGLRRRCGEYDHAGADRYADLRSTKGHDQQGDRTRARHQRHDRQDACAQHLPQARSVRTKTASFTTDCSRHIVSDSCAVRVRVSFRVRPIRLRLWSRVQRRTSRL